MEVDPGLDGLEGAKGELRRPVSDGQHLNRHKDQLYYYLKLESR